MRSTSQRGVAFIERHEGVVLRAYRDPVGIWTIGAGLTKASGVTNPKHGMEITRKDASRLLARALADNYEPAVTKHMPKANQHEFDGGVSFHFNTGAIGRASWVKAWLHLDWDTVGEKIALWRKGGGMVLPGLVRRRAEEYLLMRDGNYGVKTSKVSQRDAIDAHLTVGDEPPRLAVTLTNNELGNVADNLETLGYDLSLVEVRRFQSDHDLTVDGIIGRATLSTLQRRIDAKRKAAGAVAGGGVGATGVTAGDALAGGSGALGWVVLGIAALALLYVAWRYRDVVAAKIHWRLPRLAQFLRSI